MKPSQIFTPSISDLRKNSVVSVVIGGVFRRASLFIVACSLLLHSSSAPAISFDDLVDPQTSETTPANSNVSTTKQTTGVIGGVRYIEASSEDTKKISGQVVNGYYSHSQEFSAKGYTLVRWDGNILPTLQHNGLGSIDLTEDSATAVKVVIEGFDFPNNQPIDIRFTLYDSGDDKKVSRGVLVLNQSIGNPTVREIPFSSFFPVGLKNQNVDFKSIGAIEMFIDGTGAPAHDLAISFIGTNGLCENLVPINGNILDLCGVCGGDNSSCKDCEGNPNGPARPNIGFSCPTGTPGICANGKWMGQAPNSCTCTPDNQPTNEICDELDNDCDGAIDEGFDKGSQCSVGVGVCKNDGVKQCAPDGSVTCSVLPKPPSNEICDNLDNNCDGTTDEGFDKGAACSDGVGACLRNGVKQCLINGTIGCSAVPGAPSAEICDGIDNDCDSLVDEGFDKGTQCTVGVGACQNTGVAICSVTGTTTCSVTPKTPSAETCDNVDNDCDGSVDEGFNKGSSCTVGIGVCQKSGVIQCGQSGTAVCSVSPGLPTEEICDGLDNDCDGQIDEGFDVGGSCTAGVGACQASGVKVCSPTGSAICSASASTPIEEICDGVDNDCDGVIDEENPNKGPMVDQCGVCKGDGKSCLDCKGVINGTTKNDECGVCGGDGTSCLLCSTFDQSETLGRLDNGAKEQQIIIRSSVGVLRSIPQARREAKFISQTLEFAQKITLENWDVSWRFPIIATNCEVATSVCVSTSNVTNLALYRENNLKLRNLATDVLNKVRRYRNGRVLPRDRRLRQAAETQFQANLALSRTVPELQFACVTGTGSASATR